MGSTQIKGQAAEEAARDFLMTQGLTLCEQNFRCKLGELDLIMQDQNSLVFVEVRFRKNSAFGGAEASITHQKQRKLRRAAEFYLQRLGRVPPCRFDVLSMTRNAEGVYSCAQWIQNAF